VLIVPYIQTDGLRLNRVMVCCGSRNAAHAIADAQPFLTRAKAIELVTVVSADIKSDEMRDVDIARHLARRYLKVEVKNITATDLDVPKAILSHAADTSADFIVMGGYGHSRLREFILGGATRGILATMTIPTLMSH
jgi:nucleotide-binding universal stress UspA family protein